MMEVSFWAEALASCMALSNFTKVPDTVQRAYWLLLAVFPAISQTIGLFIVASWIVEKPHELWPLQLAPLVCGPVGRGFAFFLLGTPSVVSAMDWTLRPVLASVVNATDMLFLGAQLEQHAAINVPVGAWTFLFPDKTPGYRFVKRPPRMREKLSKLKDTVLTSSEYAVFFPVLSTLRGPDIEELFHSNQTAHGHREYDLSWSHLDVLRKASRSYMFGTFDLSHVTNRKAPP